MCVGLFYLSQASWAHAYGRAISSSGLSEFATLRERARRERASSISSGGSGPLRVGISPVRACSIFNLLIALTRSFGKRCGYVESKLCSSREKQTRVHVRD